MGALGQAVERLDPSLADAATRTEQVPTQIQEAGAGRCQAKLDDIELARLPVARQPQGTQAHQVDFLGREDQRYQLLGQSMAMTRGLDLLGQPAGPLAHLIARLGRLIGKGCGSLALDEACRILCQGAIHLLARLEETAFEDRNAEQVRGLGLHLNLQFRARPQGP